MGFRALGLVLGSSPTLEPNPNTAPKTLTKIPETQNPATPNSKNPNAREPVEASGLKSDTSQDTQDGLGGFGYFLRVQGLGFRI